MGPNSYEILGQDIERELATGIGAGAGFDSSFLINAASELASRGVNQYQNTQAANKVDSDTKVAIAADQTWANAEANAELAGLAPDKVKAAAMQALANSAAVDAQKAGASLPPDAAAKRCAAAQDAAKVSAQNAASDSSNIAKTAKMHAWQKVAAACTTATSALPGGDLALSKAGVRGGGQSSFLTKMHAGIPTWGWIAGGAVVATGGILLIRSLRKKR